MIKQITTFALALFGFSVADAEELGKWCDTPLPGISEYDVKYELRGDTEHGFALVRTFWDGSKTTERLVRNGSRFHPISIESVHYRLSEDGALEIVSESETEYILKAGSFLKSRSLDEMLSDNSVCY